MVMAARQPAAAVKSAFSALVVAASAKQPTVVVPTPTVDVGPWRSSAGVGPWVPLGPSAPLITERYLPAESGHQAPPTPHKGLAPVFPSLLMSELGLLPTGAGSWVLATLLCVSSGEAAFCFSLSIMACSPTSYDFFFWFAWSGAASSAAARLACQRCPCLSMHGWASSINASGCPSAWCCLHRSHPVLTTWVVPPLRVCLRCET